MSEQDTLQRDSSESQPIHFRVPACDVCRQRKIKCDRKAPCSSCVASHISCRTTRKAPEKKQRVLLSSRYDESLKTVNSRLEDLSGTLQLLLEKNKDLEHRPPSQAEVLQSAPPPQALKTASSTPTSQQTTEVESYEGESSFQSQSKRIAQTLELAVTASSESPGRIRDAVGVVQKLIQDASAVQAPQPVETSSASDPQSFSQYPELASRPMPPMQMVLKIINLAKISPQKFFLEYPNTNEQIFGEYCQKVYFPTQSFSLWTWIGVNAGLFFLFRELDKASYSKIEITRDQVNEYVGKCKSNVDAAVQAIKLCLEPSLEAIDALFFASTMAMENAQGSTAWKVIAFAARMCLDLGIHRLPAGLRDPASRHKRLLFWMIYSMDKTLAFNFGRTPTIHDYDITIERPHHPEDFQGPWGPYFLGFIDYAELQGEIYSGLFSARAQQESREVRGQRAEVLSEKIRGLSNILNKQIEDIGQPFLDAMGENLSSADVSSYSMLCLIYRELPVEPDPVTGKPAHPLQFHPLSIAAGRSALTMLVDAWKRIHARGDEEEWTMFVSWTLMFVPFMPFLVVFGNTIATSNKDDLSLLRTVVETIKHAADARSSIHKLYVACATFLRIGELILEGEDSQSQPAPAAGSRLSKDATGPIPPASHIVRTPGSRTPFTFGDSDQANSPNTVSAPQFSAATNTNNTTAHNPNTNHNTYNPNNLPNSAQPTAQQSWPPTAMDFSMTNWDDVAALNPQEWTGMLNEFDLGLGAESAREMGTYFGQYMAGGQSFG